MKPHLHHLTPTQTVVKVPSISLPGHYRTVRIRDDKTLCNCPARLPCHHMREAHDYLQSTPGLQATQRALLYQLKTHPDPKLQRKLRAIEQALHPAQHQMHHQSPTILDRVAALPSPRPLQAYEQLFQSP